MIERKVIEHRRVNTIPSYFITLLRYSATHYTIHVETALTRTLVFETQPMRTEQEARVAMDSYIGSNAYEVIR